MNLTVQKKVRGDKVAITVFADGKPIGTRTSRRVFRFAVVVARDGELIVASWHQSAKSLPQDCKGLVAVLEV